jgi:hypothetical protein
MNQLFNTVNYFELQAFEALRRWTSPSLYGASRDNTPFANSYFVFSLLTFPIAWKQKAAEAFLRRRLLVDNLTYANPRESSVG